MELLDLTSIGNLRDNWTTFGIKDLIRVLVVVFVMKVHL